MVIFMFSVDHDLNFRSLISLASIANRRFEAFKWKAKTVSIYHLLPDEPRSFEIYECERRKRRKIAR
jgi:hypothetical protein